MFESVFEAHLDVELFQDAATSVLDGSKPMKSSDDDKNGPSLDEQIQEESR